MRLVITWHPWWLDLLLVMVLAFVVPSVALDPPVRWAALGVGLALLLAGYAGVRPHVALRVDTPPRRTTMLGASLMVAGLLVGAAGDTTFCTLLAVVCPVVWFATPTRRSSIIATAAMLAALGATLTIRDAAAGDLGDTWTTNLAIVGFSLVFSVMIGSMVDAALRWGRERAELLEDLRASEADLAESYRQLMATAPVAQGVESPLSARETEVLGLVSEGCTNREIGLRLFISPATVKTHMEHILAKLGATTRTQAVLVAHQDGLLPGPGG
jgi:DNA-binding CsgD family transcriptional regulator